MSDDLEARVDDLEDMLDMLLDELSALESEVHDEQAEREHHGRKLRDLEQRVATVEERTDMLRLVEESDEIEGEQRSATLLQHLYRKAQRRRERGEPPRAELDREAAEEALHYPDIHRTTLYSDMERCERFVGDRDVCWYDNGVLGLDLTAGEVPQQFQPGGA